MLLELIMHTFLIAQLLLESKAIILDMYKRSIQISNLIVSYANMLINTFLKN